MWINKTEWQLEKDYRAVQKNLIDNQDKLIKTLEEQANICEDYDNKLNEHCKGLEDICKQLLKTYDDMLGTIKILETKNRALQASLNEAMKQIDDQKENKNDN